MYVGKQNPVKVQYSETRLVLLAVRDRVTGDWWQYERLEVAVRDRVTGDWW